MEELAYLQYPSLLEEFEVFSLVGMRAYLHYGEFLLFDLGVILVYS